MTTPLGTDEAIRNALASGEPVAVIGLNGRGLIQLQLPKGCDYIVLSPDQADEVADLLRKWADKSRNLVR